MHGRDDQAAAIAAESDVLEGKDAAGRSSSSDGGVPGEMPMGKQVGDMKPHGL